MAASQVAGKSTGVERLLQRVAPSDVKGAIIDPVDDKTRAQSGEIVNSVRDGGEKALIEVSIKFGDLEEGEHLLDLAGLTALVLCAWWTSLTFSRRGPSTNPFMMHASR